RDLVETNALNPRRATRTQHLALQVFRLQHRQRGVARAPARDGFQFARCRDERDAYAFARVFGERAGRTKRFVFGARKHGEQRKFLAGDGMFDAADTAEIRFHRGSGGGRRNYLPSCPHKFTPLALPRVFLLSISAQFLCAPRESAPTTLLPILLKNSEW